MSLIYKLDPRTKLLVVLLFTSVVFFINRLVVVFCLVLFLIIIRLMVKIPFHGIRQLKILTLLATFIILMQTLFGPGENYIIMPLFPASFPVLGGMGSLKWEGFILGLVAVCRLSALMILFPVFTETTSARQIVLGICALGISYRSAFIITTAFNLVPVFKEDALVIIDAQKLRGMRSFEEGSFFAKLKAYPHLVLPLVLGAMRKAQLSSVAMDSRAFGVYRTRTWLDKPKMKYYDFFYIFGCLLFTVFLLILNYMPGHIFGGFLSR